MPSADTLGDERPENKMAKRENPVERREERERLRQEIENTKPEDINQAMMPVGPEDLSGIFTMVKAFKTKFPAQAEGLIARVGKMLKATPEEMEAGLTKRPRNDWRPLKFKPIGTGGPLADARQRLEYGNAQNEVSMRKIRGRLLPEQAAEKAATPMPSQLPNKKRAAVAAAKATESIVTRVKAAIKNAPKE